MIANTNLYSGPYPTGGGVVQFPVTFTFLADSDLAVFLMNATTLVYVPLALTTDYTVVNNGEPGGSITTSAVYPSGSYIIILRDMSLVQDLDIENQETFYPSDLVGEYDYLTLLIQQLQEQINRCFKTAPGLQPAGYLQPSAGPTTVIQTTGGLLTSPNGQKWLLTVDNSGALIPVPQ